jgi:hypothetical protein
MASLDRPLPIRGQALVGLHPPIQNCETAARCAPCVARASATGHLTRRYRGQSSRQERPASASAAGRAGHLGRASTGAAPSWSRTSPQIVGAPRFQEQRWHAVGEHHGWQTPLGPPGAVTPLNPRGMPPAFPDSVFSQVTAGLKGAVFRWSGACDARESGRVGCSSVCCAQRLCGRGPSRRGRTLQQRPAGQHRPAVAGLAFTTRQFQRQDTCVCRHHQHGGAESPLAPIRLGYSTPSALIRHCADRSIRCAIRRPTSASSSRPGSASGGRPLPSIPQSGSPEPEDRWAPAAAAAETGWDAGAFSDIVLT